jgi:hypothetical protein
MTAALPLSTPRSRNEAKMPDDRSRSPLPGALPYPPGEDAWRLRGDDALMRAAAEVASPRRRLLAGLRDSHAETCARIAALRHAAAGHATARPPLRAALARLLGEAEEQLHRIETAMAQLRERPAGGLARQPALLAAPDEEEAALLGLLLAEEERGAGEAAALRRLAQVNALHMVARLLDLTAEERRAAARALRDLGAASLRPH